MKSLATRGFAATTTLQIQADANVTRGRLLHHFPSRTELLLASVDRLIEERFWEFETASAEQDGVQGLRQVIETIWNIHSGDQYWAALELRAGARSDPELAKAYNFEDHVLGNRVRRVWDSLLAPDITSRPAYVDVRELLITSMRGAAMLYDVDREHLGADRHVEIWVRTAAQLLNLDPEPAASTVNRRSSVGGRKRSVRPPAPTA